MKRTATHFLLIPFFLILAGVSDARADEPPAATAAVETEFQKVLASMGVTYLPKERRVEIDGWVNMQRGLIEVFACSEGGKTHEAVVVLDCVPSGIHAGLLALGLKPGTPVEMGTEANYKSPTGDPVLIQIRWKDKAGKAVLSRAENWIWNAHEDRVMPPVQWIFAGSFMQKVSGNPEDATYAANFVKSVVTTYHDASSILENPLAQGADDTVYYANEKAVPPQGTPITLLLQPAPVKE